MARHLDTAFPKPFNEVSYFATLFSDNCVLILEEAAKHKMAKHLHIRCTVKTDRMSAHERIRAIGGVSSDGSRWTLTQDQAIAQIEDGTSVFYIETPRGQSTDVVVAMDFHTDKYLKTVSDRERPEKLLSLPNCP